MINLLNSHPFFKNKDIASCTLLENQGYCNENYLLVASGVKYIVRKLLRDDIDRNFEWKVHTLAFKKGITAEPLVFDEKLGFMVFEFLEGEHRGGTSKEPVLESELKLLAQALQKVHSIKIEARPIKLHIKSKTKEVLQALEVVESYKKEYVLCHNDLNPQNILFFKNVKFIDWEYAGVNDRYFDVACVCVEYGLDAKMQGLFLDFYFEKEKLHEEKLTSYKLLYETLCEEWFKT